MIKINNKLIKPSIQQTDYDCAPNSIKMLMSYYRVPIKSETRFKKILNTMKNGTSYKNIIKYLQKYGDIEIGNSIYDAKHILRKKHLLFICIDSALKYSHYVILTKIGNKFIYYLDPSKDDVLQKKTYQYFINMWKPYNYWFLYLKPNKNKIYKK